MRRQAMKYDYQKLSRYLQRLENELQQLGWWSDLPPDSEAFESTAPFCHDRMTLVSVAAVGVHPKLSGNHRSSVSSAS